LPRIKKKQRELKKFVGKRKNRLSVSAPSVPAEQFSTSVLAEQLSAIEVGVKKTARGICRCTSYRRGYQCSDNNNYVYYEYIKYRKWAWQSKIFGCASCDRDWTPLSKFL